LVSRGLIGLPPGLLTAVEMPCGTMERMAKPGVLTPQDEDFPRWYLDVLNKAEMAENGPGRGTMIIRPWG
jgi:hypothetical protein